MQHGANEIAVQRGNDMAVYYIDALGQIMITEARHDEHAQDCGMRAA